MADRVSGPGEGKCCPVLTPDTGHCRSANLRGNLVPGATQQAHLRDSKLPRSLRDGSPGQPGGETEKPQQLCRTHMRARARQQGWGPRRGPVEPPAPSAPVQQASSQTPVQPGLFMERKRSDAQTEGRECWISPFRYGQGKEGRWPAHPAGASGGRWCWAAKSSTTGEGRGGCPAPTRSLPLHRQHQRVMARHSHHGEGHMWVSAGGTGRE